MTAPVRGQTFPTLRFGPFDQNAVDAYARASRDDNPIHTDKGYAQSHGLDGTIIHGMLLMGLVDSALEQWQLPPSPRRLTAKFLRPVPVGQAVEMSGKIVAITPAGDTVIRLTLRAENGDLALMGEAHCAAGS